MYGDVYTDALQLKEFFVRGDESLKRLVSFLPLCRQLKVLYFSPNIGDEGLKQLAPVLPLCLQLEELYLYGDNGVKHLASVLPHCLQLQQLTLGRNISDEGLKHLTPILPQCLQLRNLILWGNLSDDGFEHMVSVLPQCFQLRKLFLWGENIGKEIRRRGDAVLQRLDAIRSTLALLAAELGEETPLSSFTKRDGDRAVICRVVGLLI